MLLPHLCRVLVLLLGQSYPHRLDQVVVLQPQQLHLVLGLQMVHEHLHHVHVLLALLAHDHLHNLGQHPLHLVNLTMVEDGAHDLKSLNLFLDRPDLFY